MYELEIKNLQKDYKIFKKEDGIIGSLKSIFNRKFETITAVNKISFQINEGEMVGFIGPNGAGKTTTLKILSGIIYPTEGEVNVLGYTPQEKKEKFLKQIAFISAQKTQLWWDLPALDSFIIFRVIYDIDKKIYEEKIKYLSKILHVEKLLNIPIRKLSLGERMKLELIGSLLHTPKVIFLDEPTIGLDFISRQEIRNFLIKYNREYKATIILTSHYFEDIIELCKRLIIINKGEIIYNGQLQDIFNKYKDKKIIRVKNVVDKKMYENKYGKLVVQEGADFLDILLEKQNEKKFISQCHESEEIEVKNVNLEAIIRDYYEY